MTAPEAGFEMRLCWSAGVLHSAHDIARTNEWQPFSEVERLDLDIMMRAGNEVYGPGTHWIELRTSTGDGSER